MASEANNAYEHDSSDDDKPLSLRARIPLKTMVNSCASSDIPQVLDSSDDEAPLSSRIRRQNCVPVVSKSTKTTHKVAKKSKKKESQYAVSIKTVPQQGKEKKWTKLEHNGVCFPPFYTSHGVKMLYDGKPVDLSPEEEEVATMYARVMETPYVENPVFNKNFFDDWKGVLGKKHVIKEFKRCDFKPIHQWLAQVAISEKEKKKNMTSEVGDCPLIHRVVRSGQMLDLMPSGSTPRLLSTMATAGQVDKGGSSIPRKHLANIAFKLKRWIRF